MSQDIHLHLEKLKTELSKLEPAVKHLQQADVNATELISTISNINKEYSKHLQEFEKLLVDSNYEHHKKISQDIQSSMGKLNDLGERITKSFSSVEKEVKDLLDEYKFLSSETEKLVVKIDKVDFPSRLDKVDSTISSINQGLQNTQKKFDDLERNIKAVILEQTKDVLAKVDSEESNLNQRIEDFEKLTGSQFKQLSKESKLLKILLFVSIVLIFGLLVFNIL